MISPINRISTVQPNNLDGYTSHISRNSATTGSIVQEQKGLEILQKATSSIETSSAASAAVTKTELSAGQTYNQIFEQINQASYLQFLSHVETPNSRFGQFTTIFDANIYPNYFTGQLAVDMFTLFNSYNNGFFGVTTPDKVEAGGDIMHETGYFDKYIQDYKDPVVRNLAYSIIGNETDPDLIVDKIHQYLIGDANLQNGENGYDYIADVDNPLHKGLSEYWNTAKRFLEGPGGDCEDFAIAAMNLLLAVSEKPGLYGKLNSNNIRVYAVLANDGSTISEDGVVSNERVGGHAFLAYKRTDGTWVQVDGTYLPSLQSVKDRKPLEDEPNYYKSLYYFDKFGAVFERGNMDLLDHPDYPYASFKQVASMAYRQASDSIYSTQNLIGRNVAVAA